MPTYKLHYFNVDARGELIRILFAYSGIKYVDNRFNFEEWSKQKESGLFPFKQAPSLEIDGAVICQSNTICRYLARVAGIDGKNETERAKIDMIADSCTIDIVEKTYDFRVPFLEPDEAKRQEKANAFRESKLEPFLINLDALYAKYGGKYMVGDELTYADLSYYRMIDNVKPLLGDIKTPHPKLRELYERIAENPKLKEWAKNKPEPELKF